MQGKSGPIVVTTVITRVKKPLLESQKELHGDI